MNPRTPFPPVTKITARILARWLVVSPHTVLTWIHSGKLPALNITTGTKNSWVIYRKDLVAFLQKRGMSDQQLEHLGLQNGVQLQQRKEVNHHGRTSV